jgi:hypothetical protein
MVCNGFKGGTGTASRRLSPESGGYTVGVLVQCNYGSARQLRVAGIPVAREVTLQPRSVAKLTSPPQQRFGTVATLCDPKLVAIAEGLSQEHRGSIIIVIATDAPLTAEQLKRLARRASVGLGRLGRLRAMGPATSSSPFPPPMPARMTATGPLTAPSRRRSSVCAARRLTLCSKPQCRGWRSLSSMRWLPLGRRRAPGCTYRIISTSSTHALNIATSIEMITPAANAVIVPGKTPQSARPDHMPGTVAIWTSTALNAACVAR